MSKRGWLTAVLLLVLGCSREAPQPSAPIPPVTAAPLTMDQARERAQDIEVRRGSWQSVPGTFQSGEASSRFVALYDAGVLRMLEERSDLDAGASGTARFYLDTTGTLFLYDARDERAGEDAARPDGRPDARPDAREVAEVRLVFEPDGRMVASNKTVNGRVQPVQTDEIDAVVGHFEALRTAAPRP